MHLVECEHPVRVFNQYLKEYVWTPCGKCNTCKHKRSARWVARLERERQYHKFSAFITLTYDDFCLPKLVLSKSFYRLDAIDVLRDDRNSSICIPLNELDFSTPLDRKYFDKRMELYGYIPYGNFRHIQLYHKRLNKLIHDKITGKYSNFRFFTVLEYGGTTHRPHFHEILFFDDTEIASKLKSLVFDCWCDILTTFTSSCDGVSVGKFSKEKRSLGFSKVEIVEKSANSYVAQYLNELFNLPSFYKHSELRPRFVCSKRPFIGAGDYDSDDLQEIFDLESPTTLVRDSQSTELKVVPLLPCIKNRLFPKLAFFEQIPHIMRVKLYGLASLKGVQVGSFEAFRKSLFQVLERKTSLGLSVYRYITLNTKAYGKVPFCFLRRLFYISKRVVKTCIVLHMTIEEYVKKIERFYDNCKCYALRQFYDFQQQYSNDYTCEQLVHMYPEFVYQNRDCDLFPLIDCEDFIAMSADSAILNDKLTKSHYKNAYIESKSQNNPFFNFLIYFYNAQKCNENLEAFAKFCAKRLRLESSLCV